LVKNPNQVIAGLKKVAPRPGHGTHTTKKIRIEVMSKNQTLMIRLGRDSNRNQEYWVFYPDYRFTSTHEIGRITTDLFDDY
jgi:hypothetical protein